MADPDEKSLGLSLWDKRLRRRTVQGLAPSKEHEPRRLRLREPRLQAPKRKVDVRGLLKSHPTESDRGLTSQDAKSLGFSLWNQPLKGPEMGGNGALAPRLVPPEPGPVAHSGLTDIDRGLQSKPTLGTRPPRLLTTPLRREPKAQYIDKDTASRRTKDLIKEVSAAVGREDLANVALAIAMQEESTLEATNYPFGDRYPDGRNKTGDAANFGIYKMNWLMIKQCDSAKKLVPNVNAQSAWRIAGQKINDDPRLATQILIEAMTMWSTDEPDPDPKHPQVLNFWAGHRWGYSGLYDEPPPEVSRKKMWNNILNYYRAIQIVRANIESDPDVWKSHTRYGMDVPAI